MKRKYPHLRVLAPAPTPNAAEHRYFAQKALDIATAVVSGVGFVSAMLFLLTL